MGNNTAIFLINIIQNRVHHFSNVRAFFPFILVDSNKRNIGTDYLFVYSGIKQMNPAYRFPVTASLHYRNIFVGTKNFLMRMASYCSINVMYLFQKFGYFSRYLPFTILKACAMGQKNNNLRTLTAHFINIPLHSCGCRQQRNTLVIFMTALQKSFFRCHAYNRNLQPAAIKHYIWFYKVSP
ncbi:hypothetical protein SDC9_146004 [bioreactor metagenome]|uniref:Uncharacterized protein n=1 Tax=bioreactor metagenome TaxID=1076179 RepID=A0A645E9X8_9ZZZZ